jgi:hypothetical protein
MNVRISCTIYFTAGIIWQSQLRMNNYKLTVHFVTLSTNNEDHNIALDRAKYFIHNQLQSTIFINANNSQMCRQLLSTGLDITTLPEEPVDQVIGIMLYSKLNAIMEDRMALVEIELSSELGDHVVYLHSVEENLGPLEKTGWWHESTLSHCDSVFLEDANILKMNQDNLWHDLGLAWPDSTVDIGIVDNNLLFADFRKDETK